MRAQVDEYQVKAAFLYNFAKFVQWPPGAFTSSSEPIAICIIGRNLFGSTLGDMVENKTVGGRPLAVRRLPDTQHAGKCQILFVGASEGKRVPALLEPLKGASILTVGETRDFTAMGGVMSFKLDGTHVRIQVCLGAAERAQLQISSKLLSLAEIVKE